MPNDFETKLTEFAMKYDPTPVLEALDARQPPAGAMNPKLVFGPQQGNTANAAPNFMSGTAPTMTRPLKLNAPAPAPVRGVVTGRNVPSLGQLINGKG